MDHSNFSLEGFTNCVAIDQGGSAVVYRANQTDFGRLVAIKVLSSLQDPDAIERFNAERLSMGQLSGAQDIVSAYSSGITSEGHPYLVLPFYQSGSLQDYLERHGALRWRQATQHVIRVCRAVEVAHSKGIYHRDIKPANLLLADDRRVHVADFGIASLAINEPGDQSLCTPAYAPPEVLWGLPKPLRAQVDIYGLGATLWALLNGAAPFVKSFARTSHDYQRLSSRSWVDSNQLTEFAKFVEVESVPDLRQFVPDPICATIEQAMAKDPAQRFASAQAFGNALGHATRLAAEQLVKRQTILAPASTAQPVKKIVSDGASETPPRQAEASDSAAATSQDSTPNSQGPEVPYPDNQTSVMPNDQTQTKVLDNKSSTKQSSPKSDDAAQRPPAPPGSQLPEGADTNHVGSSLLLLSAVVIVVALAGAALLFAVNVGSSTGGTVGNYVGKELSAAESDAEMAGWVLQAERLRQDETTKDEILEQSVTAGADLDGDEVLVVRVSDGPVLREVPEIVGKTLEDAEKAIEEAQLTVGETQELINDSVLLGSVVEVKVDNAPADAQYETGTALDLVVSLGPEEVTIPLIASSELAKITLETELGLVVTTVSEFSDLVDSGEVIRTDPEAGAKAKPGDPIMVFLSLGPKVRDVPDVRGVDLDEARSRLEAAGFEVNVTDRSPSNCFFKLAGRSKKECDNYNSGSVWRYRPGGSRAEFGTEITVFAKL